MSDAKFIAVIFGIVMGTFLSLMLLAALYNLAAS